MMDFYNQVLPAIEKALLVDLPNCEDRRRKAGSPKGPDAEFEVIVRRPYRSDVEVFVFPQAWGDTSLGFGGVAGQSFTSAYVTVVVSDSQHAAVYMGGTLAYVVPYGHELREDIGRQNVHDVRGHRTRYAATVVSS